MKRKSYDSQERIEEAFRDRFRRLFKDCYSDRDFKRRLKEIYKGNNPQKMTDEERNIFILEYLHPEKSKREIEREAREITEAEKEIFAPLQKMDFPETNFDIDFEIEVPEVEIDSTDLDNLLEEEEETLQ